MDCSPDGIQRGLARERVQRHRQNVSQPFCPSIRLFIVSDSAHNSVTLPSWQGHQICHFEKKTAIELKINMRLIFHIPQINQL